MTFTSRSPRLSAGCALLLAAAFTAHAAPAYVAHEVLGPDGLQGLVPQAMNGAGTVCGQTTMSSPAESFILKAGGGYTTYEAIGPDFSVAMALNDHGDTAGYGFTDHDSEAYVKPHGKDPIVLFKPGFGNTNSYAFGMNLGGTVVGRYDTPDNVTHAFSWTKGQVTTLPGLGGKWTWATAVNNAGVAVGITHLPRTQGSHAVKWENGVMTDLGGLGYTNYYGDVPYDINDAGTAVGYCSIVAATSIPCVWHDGQVDTLPTLVDGLWAIAYAINNHDTVVGRAAYYDGVQHAEHAVIWKKGAISDLNDLVALPPGFTLNWAIDINDKGQVLAYGYDGNLARYFVLAPVATQ